MKVEVDPTKAGVAREATENARTIADNASLAPSGYWVRPREGTAILRARVRAGSLESHDATVAWIVARFDELSRTTILDRLGSTTVIDAPES